jgi:hypothetical protein
MALHVSIRLVRLSRGSDRRGYGVRVVLSKIGPEISSDREFADLAASVLADLGTQNTGGAYSTLRLVR